MSSFFGTGDTGIGETAEHADRQDQLREFGNIGGPSKKYFLK